MNEKKKKSKQERMPHSVLGTHTPHAPLPRRHHVMTKTVVHPPPPKHTQNQNDWNIWMWEPYHTMSTDDHPSTSNNVVYTTLQAAYPMYPLSNNP